LSFAVSVSKLDISFDCATGETVLDAVERAGYSIPYSCRKGVCSSCEGRLISGEAMVRGQGVRRGPADAVLFCQARPRSDLEIAPVRIRKIEPLQRKVFAAKVREIGRPAPDVAVIRLRLPIGRRAIFKAGQYLRVLMADGDSRNYSMANAPHRNDELELHIRRVAGGKFSENTLAALSLGSVLNIELPYGEFRLSENDKNAILIATGTGFAPIKSLIEHNIRLGIERPLHLYWGANTEADLYMQGLPRAWQQKHLWFRFTPVVSSPSKAWTGRAGFVHAAVQQDYPEMSEIEVYACGAPAMIEAAKRDFTASARLGHDDFFSDAFVASGDAERDAAVSAPPTATGGAPSVNDCSSGRTQ
jgi:CDP-4-dehydro-6-deoxyglucose reductase/3-phenylpropionate/trans-cinnamate dioxygenase ferredoxin reductase subunit